MNDLTRSIVNQINTAIYESDYLITSPDMFIFDFRKQIAIFVCNAKSIFLIQKDIRLIFPKIIKRPAFINICPI